MLQVLKNKATVEFKGYEAGQASNRSVAMLMEHVVTRSSAVDGFVRHLLEQHSPTLELEMTQLKVDAPLRSPWNRPHPRNRSLYQQPLVVRFLELVESAMSRHNGLSGSLQSDGSHDPV